MGLSIADELRARLEENPPSFNMMVLQIDDLHRIMKALDDASLLRAAVAMLREALLGVEFVMTPEGKIWCPWCSHSPFEGHHAVCRRQLALAAAAATLGE